METKINLTYDGYKRYHRWLDIGNVGAASAFLTPAIFWDAPTVSFTLLSTQAVAALYGYAVNRRYDALRAESLVNDPPRDYQSHMAQVNTIKRYVKNNKKQYKFWRMIPAVLFNREVRINGQVSTLDKSGSKLTKQTVVKRRKILFEETTEYSTLALWDKARKNALRMP